MKPLNISFELKEETIRIGKVSLKIIQLIDDKLVPQSPPIDQVKEVLKHFQESDFDYFDSKRKARALCCVILYPVLFSKIQSRRSFSKFTAIITQYPSKSIAYHLLLAVMLNWKQTFTQKKLLNLCKSYFISNNYNQDSNQFKISKYVFQSNGTELLVDSYIKFNEDLFSFLNEIGMRQTAIKSEYFEVVIKQISSILISRLSRSNNDLEKIISICNLQNDGYITKPLQVLFISRVILKVEKEQMFNYDVRHYALENIGDVDNQNWRLSTGLSNNELETINKAKNVLEGWMTELFLERFWKVIDDPRRRMFWKKYSNRMSNIKIIIDDDLYEKLDDTLKRKPYINRLYRGNTEALLIFEINNKLFIEFGGYGGGSLQVYPLHDDSADNFILMKQSKRVNKNSKPFNTKLWVGYRIDQNLMNYLNVVREYGRFAHRGNWENRLTKWMNKYA